MDNSTDKKLSQKDEYKGNYNLCAPGRTIDTDEDRAQLEGHSERKTNRNREVTAKSRTNHERERDRQTNKQTETERAHDRNKLRDKQRQREIESHI